MDIHKPKPWHGVREFLKEYLIIVVGVLTALAAEQAVEAIHTARKAVEAEDLVREEFARNVAFMKERSLLQPCREAQLTTLIDLLQTTPSDKPVPRVEYLQIGGRPYAWNQWEAAVASGIAGHFDAARRRDYQRIYMAGSTEGGNSLNAVEHEQRNAVERLHTLTLATRRISPDAREQLLQLADLARADEGFLDNLAENTQQFAKGLNLPPPKMVTRVATPERAASCLAAAKAERARLGLPPAKGT